MDGERPPPLVPAECVMSGNDWFPLYFDRLRKSKWWRRASDMARARNVMLWGEAYKATPAGSLPDDDDELAEAAGFGMHVDAFIAVKAEIMAPWVLCSDDRWYHPTVCEQVLDSWERMSAKRKADAERQRNRRNAVRVTPRTATVTAKVDGVTRDPDDVTRDMPEVTRDFTTQDKTLPDTTAQMEPDGSCAAEPARSLVLTSQPVDAKPKAKRAAKSAPPTEAEEAAFEAFWAAYPLKKGKQPGMIAFLRITRAGEATAALLTDRADAYGAERAGKDPERTKWAQGWLNDRRWEDEPLPAFSPQPAVARHTTAGGGWSALDQSLDIILHERSEQ